MINDSSAIRVVQSSLLKTYGFCHGFSLRTGGVSSEPFETLNLGRAVGDVALSVAENHRRFAVDVGYDENRLYELSQVHGKEVTVVDGKQAPTTFRTQQGDALIGVGSAIAVGVRTADCIAVLIGDPSSGAVATIHAGWRGVVAGVLQATLKKLSDIAGTEVSTWCVAIGPHIRQCCFEVGEDVAEEIAHSCENAEIIERTGPRPRVSLVKALRVQLNQQGVSAKRIDDVGGCTHCEAQRFFSYRRSGASTGRHLAVIVSR